MIIMNKFKKRLTKLVRDPQNAVVLGQGFGQLQNILEIFKTVFIFSWDTVSYKAKNLIVRENFQELTPLTDISMILVDLDQLHHLENLMPVWNRNKCLIIVEGNDPVGREKSGVLYQNHFRCIDQHGIYHVWKQQ